MFSDPIDTSVILEINPGLIGTTHVTIATMSFKNWTDFLGEFTLQAFIQ